MNIVYFRNQLAKSCFIKFNTLMLSAIVYDARYFINHMKILSTADVARMMKDKTFWVDLGWWVIGVIGHSHHVKECCWLGIHIPAGGSSHP